MDRMLLTLVLLLTTSDAALRSTSMSLVRMGKARLLADLRSSIAFTDKIGPCRDDNTVDLKFVYHHYEVLAVDDVQQAVTSVGSLELFWVDPDLAWNATDYDGVEYLAIPMDEIWHPDVIIHNAADPDYISVDRVKTVIIYSSGLIYYVTPVFFVTTCNLDLRYYPFDTQTCTIILFPYLDDVKFNITATAIGNSGDVTITGQWLTNAVTIDIYPVPTQDNMQIVSFVMVIERRYMYYVVCLFVPMILTSSMISVVFWIPPSSGEKISFIVTVFASNAVFLNSIAATMPTNMASNIFNMPRVTIFLILVNIQCMLAMALTIFVLRLYEQEEMEELAREAEVLSEPDADHMLLRPRKEDNQAKHDKTAQDGAFDSPITRMISYLLRKLTIMKSRVVPSEKGKAGDGRRKPKRKPRCCLKSSTWDTIFFWFFFCTSCPIYYILFKT